MTTYFWPPSGQTARGVALTPYGVANGLLVPDEHAAIAWPFNGASFSPSINLFTGGKNSHPGIVEGRPDGANGAWLLTYRGVIVDLASGGLAGAPVVLPISGFTGLSVSGATLYALAASGSVYSSGGAVLGSYGAPGWDLHLGSGSLYSILASESAVGTLALPGFASGTLPFTPQIAVPTCLATSGASLVAAGWGQALLPSGFAALALDPANPLLFASCSGSTVSLWTIPSGGSNIWTFNQAVSGLSPALGNLAWTPNGTQILATDPTAGVVDVLTYSAGLLSFSGSLTLTGSAGIAIAADSLHGLVAQPGASGALPVSGTLGGVWATVPGNFVSGIAGGGPVLMLSSTQAALGYASGVAILTLTGGLWSLTSRLAMGFRVQFLALDPATGWAYGAGASGIGFFTATGVLGTSGFSHSDAIGLVASQGQAAVFLRSGAWLSFGSPDGQSLQLMVSGTPSVTGASGATSTGAGLAGSTIFASILSSGGYAAQMWNFSAPFTLVPARQGAVAFHGSGGWTYYDLGVDRSPTAVTFDASGNARIAACTPRVSAIGNFLFTAAPTGGVASAAIPQYQPSQSVLLGVSRLFASGAATWMATSLPGVLIED